MTNRHWLWVSRLRNDPYKSVLRERTGSPIIQPIRGPPLVRRQMMGVVRLEQRDENVDIKQRPHALDVLFEQFLDELRRDDLACPRQQTEAAAVFWHLLIE